MRPIPAAPAVRPCSRALVAAGAALLALAAAPAAGGAALHAQPVTFDELGPVDDSGVRYVANCYVSGGFRFTLVGQACGTEAAFGTWTADSPLFYTGSPALFNNLGPSVDITAAGGQLFSLTSLDLASLLGAFGNPTTVSFMGMLQGGGSVMQEVMVAGGTTMPMAVTLTGFTNLSSVRMTVVAPDYEPYVQLDNLQGAVVPEPATIVLVAGGLAALGAVARRRAGRRAA